MATLHDRQGFLAELELKNYTEEQKAAATKEYDRRRKGQLIREGVAEERAAQQGSMLRRAGGTAGAFGLNLANQALLGRLPQAIGAMRGPEARGEVARGLEISRQTNPLAAGAGTLGGLFTGPAGAVLKGGGRLATRVIPTGALTAKMATRGIIARGTANVANALTASAGALGAIRLTEAREDDGGLRRRLADAADDVTSPINLGLAAVSGGLTAKFSRIPDSEILAAVKAGERHGLRVSPDALRDSSSLQGLFKDLAHLPFGRKIVSQFLEKNIYGPLRKQIDAIRRGTTAEGAEARAAGAFQKIAGPGKKPSRPRVARLKEEAEALAAEGRTELSVESQRLFLSTVRELTRKAKKKGTEGERGEELTSIIRDFGRAVAKATKEGRRITLEQLDPIRQRLGEAARFKDMLVPGQPKASARAVREARELYSTTRLIIEREFSAYESALRSGERLRRMESALADVKIGQTPDTNALNEVFSKGDVLTRWRAIQEHGATAEVEAIRGWYIARAVESLFGKGRLKMTSKAAFERLENRKMFSPQVFDAVAPGVRAEMRQVASLMDRLQKGVARAEGSPTASRGATAFLLGGASTLPASALAFTDVLISNPFYATALVLGPVGTKMFLKSLIGGRVGADLNRLASVGEIAGGAPKRLPGRLGRLQSGLGGLAAGRQIPPIGATRGAELLQRGAAATPNPLRPGTSLAELGRTEPQ